MTNTGDGQEEATGRTGGNAVARVKLLCMGG